MKNQNRVSLSLAGGEALATGKVLLQSAESAAALSCPLVTCPPSSRFLPFTPTSRPPQRLLEEDLTYLIDMEGKVRGSSGLFEIS